MKKPHEPIVITPAMMKALCAPLPNFHESWKKYKASGFRRAALLAWAGDDPEKLRAAEELLDR